MFGLPVIQFSEKARVTAGTLTGEVIATAGFIAITFTLVYRDKKELIPVAVAGWIGAAYFFYLLDLVCQSSGHNWAGVFR
jgi:hypothetical protein